MESLVLVSDDDTTVREVQRLVPKVNVVLSNLDDLDGHLDTFDPILVVTEVELPEVSPERVERASRRVPGPPIVTLSTTGAGSGFSRALENARQVRETALVVESPLMRNLIHSLTRVAPSDTTVLLTGESGTGKDALARYLHDQSTRADGPFVCVNCAAIPEQLFESEMFGHTKGAFTGAVRARQGVFREASGGTLFLDEVSEIPLHLQAKLLRALQDHSVRPVGGDRDWNVDIRVVAATNQDLGAAVREGRFREDLFHRLAVVPALIPPLRERRDDVLAMTRRFLREIAPGEVSLTPEARAVLLAHDWPGNVRELYHTLERGATLRSSENIGAADLLGLHPGLETRVTKSSRDDARSKITLEVPSLDLGEVRDVVVEEALRVCGGRRKRAAELLGVNVRTLRGWLNGS